MNGFSFPSDVVVAVILTSSQMTVYQILKLSKQFLGHKCSDLCTMPTRRTHAPKSPTRTMMMMMVVAPVLREGLDLHWSLQFHLQQSSCAWAAGPGRPGPWPAPAPSSWPWLSREKELLNMATLFSPLLLLHQCLGLQGLCTPASLQAHVSASSQLLAHWMPGERI